METPHYLRFVRALTLVATAGCSDNTASTPDASPDVVADTVIADAPADTTTTDVAADVTPDVVADVVADVARDVLGDVTADAPSDAQSDVAIDAATDVSPRTDAVADEGGTTADAPVDVAADVNPCPATAPMSGANCDVAGASCRWDIAGGGFTSCTCVETAGVKSWSCATAVPGPLPPPELERAGAQRPPRRSTRSVA